ncbi:MAG: L-threonylcarbamoyladenylate synthase [Actinomycetota bacterium]|nr:L-threonylcarbamoyladenylate synthase [Actinomycetota bacterium]
MRIVSPEEAAAALRAGGVAVVPTETVVGLVAAEPGLTRVRDAKGREARKPIALLCTTAEEAFSLAAVVPPLARRLAELYWPGPLTLVLDRRGGGTVGLRVPAGKVAREVLAAYGGPLFATSANLSGEPAPRSLADVDPRVCAAVDVVVEGEPGSGEASAVVDLSGGAALLLRPSVDLTAEALSELIGS